MRCNQSCWPDLDLRGQTLDEIRRRVRGKGVGIAYPPPQVREPEKLGDVLERMREQCELPRAENE